ncbi:MAG: hypothetical protein JNN26_23660 [Candidatus Obscuribacter sp.]|nr:hypothetical protein [Candidatus Obscuribacter sp.]
MNTTKHHCTNNGGKGWSQPDTEATCMEQEDGRFILMVNLEEFCTHVNFCPFCGEKAPTQSEFNSCP